MGGLGERLGGMVEVIYTLQQPSFPVKAVSPPIFLLVDAIISKSTRSQGLRSDNNDGRPVAVTLDCSGGRGASERVT